MNSKPKMYAGQILWARCSTYPYWPSIVWPSDSGVIQDSNKLVHVRLCGDKGKSCWAKIENIFEFNGIESFIEKKRSMKCEIGENAFKDAFDTEQNKAWRNAVVQAVFISRKDLKSRLAFFDIIEIHSLRENCKNPRQKPNISEMILEHSSRQQLAAIERIIKENHNICDKVQQELNEIASNINFNDTYLGLTEGQTRTSKKNRRYSEPLIRHHDPSHATQLAELKSYIMKSYPKDQLFRNSRQSNICKICLDHTDDIDLVKCSGDCGDHVHKKCIDNVNDSFVNLTLTPKLTQKTKQGKRKSMPNIKITTLFCNECNDPVCCACKESGSTESKLARCNFKSCRRYYHDHCLDDWRPFIEHDQICPIHVCHTCISDDSDETNHSTSNSKFTYCVNCPTTYHINSCCIPAGTVILTKNRHLCIRHRPQSRKPASLDWCYCCGEEGGVLLSCDSCPLTGHMLCLKLSETPGRFLCNTCEHGRHPLYGEIVWVKDGTWWPAIIVPPFCIPDNLIVQRHNQNDFCVRFFGSNKFAWIGRSWAYLYAEGDRAKSQIGEPRHDEAIKQADDWFRTLNRIGNGNNNITEKRDRQTIPYIEIDTIKTVPPAKLIKYEYYDAEPCACCPNDNDPCGPTSDCANRKINYECEPNLCPCGSKCKNQNFQQKMYARCKLMLLGEKGFGLLANECIRAGTLVGEYVGELITDKEFLRRNTKHIQNYYFMKYEKGYIDAKRKGNVTRFVNHSCNPNCKVERWIVNGVYRIGFIALKNIEKGTELTIDYKFGEGNYMECFCGENNCKGYVGSKIR